MRLRWLRGGVSAVPGFLGRVLGLEPRPAPTAGGGGSRACVAEAGVGRGCAQRKGLVPACGGSWSGAAEPDVGSSGCGRLAGGGVKAPACGKTLTEAGRVTPAGTLLSGRGREAL